MSINLVEWSSKKWFSLIHSNNLVYNTCWEDPRVDRIAMGLSAEDTLMTITSAGCNVLDYALLGPKRIYAVDINPNQNALLELKMAGIRTLDFDSFFEIFGKGGTEEFPSLYKNEIREALSPQVADYWDRRLNYFSGPTPTSSFYYRGSCGALARWLNHYIDFNKIREPIRAIFEADSVMEQEYIYKSVLRSAFWCDLLKWVLQWDLPFAFIGVPRTQRQQVEESYQGGMGQFIEDCLEAVFARIPLKDNYFWWLYFNGSYSRNRCPEYLKRENFYALKDGLVDSVTVCTNTIVNFLSEVEDKISRFVLLDHMDWLRGTSVLKTEWENLFKAAAPNARLLWRSASVKGQFVNDVEVNWRGSRAKVKDFLRYDSELAYSLQSIDRVHTYGSFCIADLVH